MTPMHSMLHAKGNDAYLYIYNDVRHIVLLIGDRNFFISVDDRKSEGMVYCKTEREAVVALHNILLFSNVDTVYFINRTGIEAASAMTALYARNDMATWFWGIERPGSIMFECRGVTITFDAISSFKCPLVEDLENLKLNIGDPIGDAMSLLYIFQAYVKFHPLTYNKV